MTSTRDFQSPDHRNTLPLQEAQSPNTMDNTRLDRQGSVVSQRSMNGSVRNRHGRSNTVKTYNEPEHPNWQPGAEPGIDTTVDSQTISPHLEALRANCGINIIDFSDSNVMSIRADNANLSQVLDEPRNDELPCRWISVNGLSWDVIKLLGNKYGLHRLAIEDMIITRSRTKVDWYSDHAFVVLTLQKLVRLHHHDAHEGPCECTADQYQLDDKGMPLDPRRHWWQKSKNAYDHVLPRYEADEKMHDSVNAHTSTSADSPIQPIRTLHRYESGQIPEHTAFMEQHSALSDDDFVVSVEQVSIFLLSENIVISFFEHSAADVESPILDRLESPETILRRSGDASLLLQAIIDAIVDLALSVRDAYNKARKELQIDVLTSPDIKTSRALHIFGEEIDMLQNLFKPIVHLVNALRDHQSEPLNLATQMPETQPGNAGPGGKKMPAFKRKPSRIPMDRVALATSVNITPLAHTYLLDVLDHCITMINSLEQMDASANNLSSLIFSTVGARTNNFMMILAIVTVLFAPLTFVSGYFGSQYLPIKTLIPLTDKRLVNFSNGNGLDHPFSFFWLVALPSLAVFMLLVLGSMIKEGFKGMVTRKIVNAARRQRRISKNRQGLAGGINRS